MRGAIPSTKLANVGFVNAVLNPPRNSEHWALQKLWTSNSRAQRHETLRSSYQLLGSHVKSISRTPLSRLGKATTDIGDMCKVWAIPRSEKDFVKTSFRFFLPLSLSSFSGEYKTGFALLRHKTPRLLDPLICWKDVRALKIGRKWYVWSQIVPNLLRN